MQKRIIVVVLLSAVAMASCSHAPTTKKLSIVEYSAKDAHVCGANGDVKEGDKVLLIDNSCRYTTVATRSPQKRCDRKVVGEVTITHVDDEHCFTVGLEPGVVVTSSTEIEKK